MIRRGSGPSHTRSDGKGADRGIPMGIPSQSAPKSGLVGSTANNTAEANTVKAVVPSGTPDPLAALGPILAFVAQRDIDAEQDSARRLQVGDKFSEDFVTACETEVRPAMDAVLERLRQLGGDALIEEHPGGEARFKNQRLTLWMSLKGSIAGEPRLDRHPYLQFEADVEARKVKVDEGDMWRGGGGHTSGRVGMWEVSDLTRQRVTEELLAVVARAAGSNSTQAKVGRPLG